MFYFILFVSFIGYFALWFSNFMYTSKVLPLKSHFFRTMEHRLLYVVIFFPSALKSSDNIVGILITLCFFSLFAVLWFFLDFGEREEYILYMRDIVDCEGNAVGSLIRKYFLIQHIHENRFSICKNREEDNKLILYQFTKKEIKQIKSYLSSEIKIEFRDVKIKHWLKFTGEILIGVCFYLYLAHHYLGS